MKQRTVGQSGLRVSQLGLGTATWGRETTADEAAAQLHAFTDAGGTLIDTSPSYNRGAAQSVLAELLQASTRSQLVLSGCAGGPGNPPAPADNSRRALLSQLDATLRELGTGYLDVWSVAGWDTHTPVAEVAAALEYAVATGRALYVGARNLAPWQLATLAATVPLVPAQAPYSLLHRVTENEFIPAAMHHGAGVFAAVPLAGGILTGKYRDGVPADSRGADQARGAEIAVLLDDHAESVVDAVVTAADGLGTSPLAVAIAWVRDQPGVSATIVGARDGAQLTGVLAAETLELPPAIAAALGDVSAGAG